MISRLKGFAFAASLALALAAGAVAPASAQEISPDQLALARKYVDLTNKAQIYEAMAVLAAEKTSRTLVGQNPGLETQINDAIGKALEARKGKSDELFDQIARIYAVTFSADELQQIVTFYETPVGQKLATTAQATNQDAAKVVQIYARNFEIEFAREVKAALKAAGYNV